MDELIKYFDYTYYINNNLDLKNMNFLQAKWHCFGRDGIGDGIKEGRIFCKQLEYFNKKEYLNNISKNSNLIKIYLNYLMNYNNKEQKILIYFDYSYYIINYPDTKKLNEQEAKIHFINTGIYENRKICKQLEYFNKKE